MWGKHLTNKHKAKMSATLSDGRLKGSRNGMVKLTEKEVSEIKVLLKNRQLKQCQIAEMYEVTDATVSLIKSGKTWTHVRV